VAFARVYQLNFDPNMVDLHSQEVRSLLSNIFMRFLTRHG